MHAWLHRLDAHFPVRYTAWLAAGVMALLGGFAWVAFDSGQIVTIVGAALAALGWRDTLQRRHAVLRNYPVIGHLRYLFEYVRPELRQYFIESDREAAPFSRQQRSLVYQRAKTEADQRPFGTQLDMHTEGHEWINHSIMPSEIVSQDFRVTIGAGPGTSCSRPYEASVFNISAMSFGSLSAPAILALNRGAKLGGFAHDTGEGSISVHHLQHGGNLIWETGSGYFGCRDAEGRFDPERFATQAREPQVRMVEVKLSQGAKPGHGGVLPGAKVTPEIAAARGVPIGRDCISPARHSAFSTPVALLRFVEHLRGLSGGKPVGFKLCVGHAWEWFAICKAMLETDIVPDFIVVDGAEGGTGAAPLEFPDHVGAPLQEGLQLVHNTLVGLNLRERTKIGCAGKVIGAFDIARAIALGADWCNSARGFMFALGCIQSQSCHTGACPTGVATQDPLRQRALEVGDKAERVFRYHEHTLHALKALTQSAGLDHPGAFRPTHIVRRVTHSTVRPLADLLPIVAPGALRAALDGQADWPGEVYRVYWPLASADSFAPTRPLEAVVPSR